MAALPVSTDFTGSAITEAQFKTAITGMRDYLAGLFSATGVVADAKATLQISGQILPVSASVAANAMTVSASALALDFRSVTLGSGTVSTVSGTPSNLVIPSSATLGTVSAVVSRIVVLAMNNGGTIELAVVNISGGNDLSETGLISTTAISAAATSASVVYSTTARTNLAYRVIGVIESTQATAGTWASAPSKIQGAGGQALTSMSSVGYGQTLKNVTGSRALATTYYNTTGRPIWVKVIYNSTIAGPSGLAVTMDGITTVNPPTYCQTASYGGVSEFLIPVGKAYSITAPAGGTLTAWYEIS